jgi:chaperonin GroEL (HSP60 family)
MESKIQEVITPVITSYAASLAAESISKSMKEIDLDIAASDTKNTLIQRINSGVPFDKNNRLDLIASAVVDAIKTSL